MGARPKKDQRRIAYRHDCPLPLMNGKTVAELQDGNGGCLAFQEQKTLDLPRVLRLLPWRENW